MHTTDARRILGAFIRAHRERLEPPAKAGRRRTPGWRREELADAAGLGVTWVTWLEQGREVNASVAALSRLAEALQLNEAERASLFDLAGKRDPLAQQQEQPLPSALLALPAALTVPAYLLDHAWTARAWNDAAAELLVGWLDESADSRNLLRYVFLTPAAQTLMIDWPERARRLVAEFRADFNRRPGDPQMQALVDSLLSNSPRFAEHWSQQDVLYREEGGERSFRHPQRGVLHFQQTTLLAAARQAVKLVCLVPGEAGDIS